MKFVARNVAKYNSILLLQLFRAALREKLHRVFGPLLSRFPDDLAQKASLKEITKENLTRWQ